MGFEVFEQKNRLRGGSKLSEDQVMAIANDIWPHLEQGYWKCDHRNAYGEER